jgi:hypothetical protein
MTHALQICWSGWWLRMTVLRLWCYGSVHNVDRSHCFCQILILLAILVCMRTASLDVTTATAEGDKLSDSCAFVSELSAITWLLVLVDKLSHCGAVRDHHGPGIKASDESSSCLAVEPCHLGVPGASLPVSSTWRRLSVCKLKSCYGCMQWWWPCCMHMWHQSRPAQQCAGALAVACQAH